jgi:hypothetical protein
MKKWDITFSQKLLSAENYRDFIKMFFCRDSDFRHPKKLTYGEFAKRSGFASKSYLNDIVAGRKRIAPGGFEKVVLGLGLNATWAKYFKCLVSKEESEFRALGKSPTDYHDQLQRLRGRLKGQLSSIEISRQEPQLQQLILGPNFPEIYASLGSVEKGETFENIQKKARIPKAELEVALNRFVAAGWVRYDDSTLRYIPRAFSLDAYGLDNSEFFRIDYLRSLERLKMRFSKQCQSKTALFMTQSISVRASQLMVLRERLSEVVENFASQAEDSDGDCIAEIQVSLTHNVSE